MSNRYLQMAFTLIIISTYYLLFYSVFSFVQIQDFTSFYSAIINLINNKNPYTTLVSDFLPLTKKLSANLNPPIVLWLFSPLAKFSYPKALVIWSVLSFTLGLIGAGLSFYYAFSTRFFQKNGLMFLLFYLSVFSTMMNVTFVQFGSILLFFIMIGYHFYLKNRHFLAGILWGIIIAFKFFPALLFIYVLKQRRMNVFFIMLATTSIAFLIPYLIHGRIIYTQYFSMMSHVYWYGDNWNASLFGFVFRLFTRDGNINKNPVNIEIIYFILFIISLLWYLKKLRPNVQNQINHQPFCLTLTMMLLMSPFGWFYYFPLLIFPLTLTCISAYSDKNYAKNMIIWCFSLFFINIPQGYILNKTIVSYSEIFFSSYCFYGLLLLNYLCAQQDISGKNEIDYDEQKQGFIGISLLILIFGLIVTDLRFLLHLY